MCFRSLSFFSAQRKEEKIPLLEIIIEEKQLLSLPLDMLKEIFQKLDGDSIMQLTRVNKFSHEFIKKHFNENLLISDLLEKYTSFASKLESKQRIHQRLPSFFTDNSEEGIDHRKVTIPLSVLIGIFIAVIASAIFISFAISPEPNDPIFSHSLGIMVGMMCVAVVFLMMIIRVGLELIDVTIADNVEKIEVLKDRVKVLPEVIKDKIDKIEFVARKPGSMD